MLSSTTGYGYFVQSGLTTCKAIVASTNDGGSTFVRPVVVSTWSCNGNTTPPSLMTFDTHGDGFLYGPGLATTHNGGLTWITTPHGGNIISIIVTSHALWMLTNQCSSGEVPSGGCPLLLQYSHDGGRSWVNDTYLPSTARPGYSSGGAAAMVAGPNGGLDLLLAPSPSTASSSATLWQSNSSGGSWNGYNVPCGFSPYAVALAVGPGGELVAGCGSEPGTGQQPKSIVVSSNGGTTWKTAFACRLSPTIPATCLHSPLVNGYLGEIAAPTSARIFLVGSRSPLLVSSNGGASWAPAPSVAADSGGGTLQVHFFNSQVGFLLGDDANLGEVPVIWRTRNGGSSWTTVSPKLR